MHLAYSVGRRTGRSKPQSASRIEGEAIGSAGGQRKLKEGVAGILWRVANECVSAVVHEPDGSVVRNDQAIERCRMTCNCWYRQLRHPASRTINQAKLARYNFGKPDASPGITRHREDLRLGIDEMIERDTTRGGVEMTNGATCQETKPDLPIGRHGEAERQSGELR